MAVRKVIKQLLGEMLQQCPCGSSCMLTHHHGGAQHRMSAFRAFCTESPKAVSFCDPQYACDVVVVACCMNSTISTALFQQTISISFLTGVYSNFFGLFGEYICIQYFDCY
jgi:hypothetical protein